MDNFTIKITEDSRLLTAVADARVLGSQYDSCVQRLFFLRTEKFIDDDLILYFTTGEEAGEPINIGQENEFVVTGDLTQGTELRLQLAFESKDGERIEHSDEIKFALRDSVMSPVPTGGIMDQLRELKKSAFVQAEYIDSEMVFKNTEGEEIYSVIIAGQSGTAGSNVISPETEVNNIEDGQYIAVEGGKVVGRASASGRAAEVPTEKGSTVQNELDRSAYTFGHIVSDKAYSLDVKKSGTAVVTAIQLPSNTSLTDAVLVSRGGNLFDESALVPSYTYNGITVGYENGKIRVTRPAGGGTGCIKITNGMDGANFTPSATGSWSQENIEKRDYMAICNVTGADDFTDDSETYIVVTLAYNNAEGTAVSYFSTKLQGANTRNYKDGFYARSLIEAWAANSRPFCIYVRVLGGGAVDTSFNLLYTNTAAIPGSYMPYTEHRLMLPQIPDATTWRGNAAWEGELQIPVIRDGTLRVESETGDYPLKVDFYYPRALSPSPEIKKYSYKVPDGLFTTTEDKMYASVITSSADLWNIYDAFVASNPEYVSKQTIGTHNTSGAELYAWTFKPVRPETYSGGEEAYYSKPSPSLPKLLISGGVHGDERTGYNCIAWAMQQIVNNWQSDPLLEFLRFNCVFVIAPRMSLSTVRLVDTINPNRDFYANRFRADQSKVSEFAEYPAYLTNTRALLGLMQNNLDADFYIDSHNINASNTHPAEIYTAGTNGDIVAYDAAGTQLQYIMSSVLENQIRSLKQRYPDDLGSNFDSVETYVGVSASIGSSVSQMSEFGIPSLTLETRRSFVKDGASFDRKAQLLSAETFINTLLGLLRFLSR